MIKSDQIDKLAAALAKAQGAIEDAEKDSTNPHFKSRYSDFASVRAAVRRPLSDNGLSYVQLPRTAEKCVEVETVLLHESGQFIGETLTIPPQGMTAHQIGSAITYAKRYGLMAIVGLASSEDDDDGNAAQGGPRGGSRHVSRQEAYDEAPPPPPPMDQEAQDFAAQARLFDEGNMAASFGEDALRAYWQRLTPAQKKYVGGAEQLARWKTVAEQNPFKEAAE